MITPRRLSAAGFLVLAVGLVVGATAWACSATGVLSPAGGVDTAQGVAGSQVTVAGSGFAADKPVEIHWNSVPNKLRDAQADTNGRFSVAVTIPSDAREGVYMLLAAQTDREFTVAPGRMSFEVTPGPQAGSPDSVSGGGRVPEGVTSGSVIGGTGRPGTVVQTPAFIGSPGSGSGPLTASANPPAVVTAPGQAVFSGSLAPALDDSSRARGLRSATGDLWSGFRSGTRSSLAPTQSDGLPGGSGPGLAVGIGLLGAGLVALFGGFGAAEMQRRRAFAQARSTR